MTSTILRSRRSLSYSHESIGLIHLVLSCSRGSCSLALFATELQQTKPQQKSTRSTVELKGRLVSENELTALLERNKEFEALYNQEKDVTSQTVGRVL